MVELPSQKLRQEPGHLRFQTNVIKVRRANGIAGDVGDDCGMVTSAFGHEYHGRWAKD